MQQVKETRTERVTCFVMFCLILGFYETTRPFNQAESYDSINYELFAQRTSRWALRPMLATFSFTHSTERCLSRWNGWALVSEA